MTTSPASRGIGMALGLLAASASLHAADRIAGRYTVSYGMAGYEIEIRDDHTFSYANTTDLHDARTEGTWEEVAPGVIRATSYGRPAVENVTGTRNGDGAPPVRVIVLDTTDVPVPGAMVRLWCDDAHDPTAVLTTGDDGEIAFDACVPSTLVIDVFGMQSVAIDNRTTRWTTMTFRPAASDFRIDGDLWLLFEGKLWLVQDRPLEREPSAR